MGVNSSVEVGPLATESLRAVFAPSISHDTENLSYNYRMVQRSVCKLIEQYFH